MTSKPMNGGAIRLVVHGLGHVISFKNTKMLARGRLFTKPEYQLWMQMCQAGFESQLRSLYQTIETEMPMERSLRSWIPCVMPLDDSVNCIPKIQIQVVKVPKGQEGAEILIEPV